MNKKKEFLQVDPGVAEGTKSLDELAEEVGAFEKPKRPVPVEQPETNPDHGPTSRMPEEHMIPLEEAAEGLEKKE
jgi:hypothetical protein